MKKLLLILLLLGAAFLGGLAYGFVNMKGGAASSMPFSAISEKSAITQTLKAQSAAWSAGDIDRFMQDYWQSDKLRFASGGTVQRGWQTTLDRYKARYPDRAAMGELSFTDLEIEILSPSHALVFGRWTLSREADAPTGLFTLHMRKEGERWVIVSDHTSSAG